MNKFLSVIATSTVIFFASPAAATFSIVACDTKSGSCGVAVATNNLAVGGSVPYVQAGVGAVAVQFDTNPKIGPTILSLLAQETPIGQALIQAIQTSEPFEGQGREWRQVGVVSARGETANHDGVQVIESGYAGHLSGVNYAVQGNGLAGAHVLERLSESFLATTGDLPSRLLAALEAGYAAGGQTIGHRSAALIVRTMDGWPIDIDLRVDSSDAPVPDLRRVFNEHYARIHMARAERMARNDKPDEALALAKKAIGLAPRWDRIARRAALLAHGLGEPKLATLYFHRFQTLNPVWASQYCPAMSDASFAACAGGE